MAMVATDAGTKKDKKKSLLLLGVARLFFLGQWGTFKLDESSRWQSALHGLNRLQSFVGATLAQHKFLQPDGRAWPGEKVKTEMPRQPEEPWWLVAREKRPPHLVPGDSCRGECIHKGNST